MNDEHPTHSPAPPPPSAHGEEAFAKHVVPEVDTLYRVALSLTRNHADAEDIVQDTLLRAYRSIDRFDGRYPRASSGRVPPRPPLTWVVLGWW